jgi:hypothetical protein
VASKFFEHFVAIVDAINTVGGTGLWDEEGRVLLRPAPGGRPRHATEDAVTVGVLPLIACEMLEESAIRKLPDSASECSGSSIIARTWRGSSRSSPAAKRAKRH